MSYDTCFADLRCSLVALVLVTGGCAEEAIPKRPAHVPAEAVWAGGVDGAAGSNARSTPRATRTSAASTMKRRAIWSLISSAYL